MCGSAPASAIKSDDARATDSGIRHRCRCRCHTGSIQNRATASLLSRFKLSLSRVAAPGRATRTRALRSAQAASLRHPGVVRILRDNVATVADDDSETRWGGKSPPPHPLPQPVGPAPGPAGPTYPAAPRLATRRAAMIILSSLPVGPGPAPIEPQESHGGRSPATPGPGPDRAGAARPGNIQVTLAVP